MKRKTFNIIAAIIAIVFVIGIMIPLIMGFVSPPAYAKTAAELQKDLNSNKKTIDSLNDRLSGIVNQRNGVLDQKRKLDEEIRDLNSDIQTINKEIDTQEREIKQKEEEIQLLEEDIVTSNDLLKARLRTMYEKGNSTYIDIIFSSTSFSDMLLRIDMVKQILAHDKQLIAELKAKKDKVQETKASIEAQQAEKEKMRVMLSGQKEKLNEKIAESTALIQNLNNDEEETKRILAAREKEEQEILDAIEAASKKYTPSQVYGGGKLGWPAPIQGTVTSKFGMRTLRGLPNNHTGVDIAVPTGTPVLASEAGVVIEAKWYNDYGMCVIINHGSISTLYAHNSAFNVSVGQQVKKGDIIAYSGSTGNSTGPHIHIGVIDNAKSGSSRVYLDPWPYLMGQ